jgi:DNA repair protein RecO (recombination protein O)
MKYMQKYTAIILSSRNVSEFDRMYAIYTKESGLAWVVGRGVRKPTAKLAGHLEPGTLSEVYVARSRGKGQITSAITLDGFADLKKDFEALNDVLAIFRFFVRKFDEGEADERIFDLLAETLTRAGLSSSNTGLAIEAFWWKLFDFLGGRPETMKCAVCGATANAQGRKFFSVERGGIVCEKCVSGERNISEISIIQIKLLRVFLANSLGKSLKVRVDEKELAGLGRIRKEFRKYNF